MAAMAISMPSLGMTMEEGRVVEWRVAVGERIAKGEILLVIESEKSEVEIESIATGHLRHVYVELDEVVPCGSLLAALTDDADELFDADAFRAATEPAREAAPTPRERGPAPARMASCGEAGAPRAAGPATSGGARIAPAARAAARKLGVPIEAVTGTGRGGLVLRQDVEAFAEARRDLVDVGDGVRLEAPSSGEGDPVLLLPGFGTDVSVFARQITTLAERHRVIGLNPRGVGLSDAPESDVYTISQGAADAARVAGEAVHVVGASMGAAVAIELAIVAPERVRSLTLITPFVQASARLLAVIDAWANLAATAAPETLAAAMLPWFFSDALLGDDSARARTARGLSDTLARVKAPALARWAAGIRAWSGSRAPDLARIDAPTLVIAGAGDLLAPDGEILARQIPGARFVGVPNAGHAVALEASDAVNAALEAHLSA